MTDPRLPFRYGLSALVLLGLAACGDRDGTPAPAQNGMTNDIAAPSKSIIRDEARTVPIEDEVDDPIDLTLTLGEAEELDARMQRRIDEFIGEDRILGDGAITLLGHSDSLGGGDAIEDAEARATIVRDYLVDLGIDEDRITIVSLGDHNPVEPNWNIDGTPNEDGANANRRVEIVLGTVESIMQRREAMEREEEAVAADLASDSEPQSLRSMMQN